MVGGSNGKWLTSDGVRAHMMAGSQSLEPVVLPVCAICIPQHVGSQMGALFSLINLPHFHPHPSVSAYFVSTTTPEGGGGVLSLEKGTHCGPTVGPTATELCPSRAKNC